MGGWETPTDLCTLSLRVWVRMVLIWRLPRAFSQACRLAVEYRQRFQRDVVVDMLVYRKHGHNEVGILDRTPTGGAGGADFRGLTDWPIPLCDYLVGSATFALLVWSRPFPVLYTGMGVCRWMSRRSPSRGRTARSAGRGGRRRHRPTAANSSPAESSPRRRRRYCQSPLLLHSFCIQHQVT
jgi:hypothetical protein